MTNAITHIHKVSSEYVFNFLVLIHESFLAVSCDKSVTLLEGQPSCFPQGLAAAFCNLNSWRFKTL